MTENSSAPPIPSASILALRDAPSGLEVLMLQRREDIGDFGGILAFPGGKVDPGESDGLRELADGAEDLSDKDFGLRAAAIREAFEETGFLIARHGGADGLMDPATLPGLAGARAALEHGGAEMAALCSTNGLRLACDALVPYAHWITPSFRPKRFDTWFYLLAAPPGQTPSHEGGEAEELIWLRPMDAIAEAEAGRRTIVFVTRLNLMKLAQSATVEAALAAARKSTIVTCSPERFETDEGPRLRIPREAGYPISELPMLVAAGKAPLGN